jgi:hypothetical protein
MIGLDELRAHITAGVSAEQLLALLRKNETSIPEPIWRRCAILRYFDEVLYNRHIALGVNSAPAFAQLISRPEVEPQPGGSTHRYVLRSEPRAGYIRAWLEFPDELAEFASGLVAYYTQTGDALNAFTHRLLCEPEAALDEFGDRYAAADRIFDLATCDTLLQILRNRAPLLTQQLRAALADREVYLRSRTLFAEDYYRTSVFQPRTEALSDFEWVLSSRRSWLFQIYGAGGVGKSLFLQWLIARYCVEECDGRRVPVARIDFDQIDLISLGPYPWLVLLPIAQQLTQQLVTNPFRELLVENEPIIQLLESVSADQGGIVDSSRSQLAEALATGDRAETVPRQFAAALGNSRIVVVLDTAEEALLHQAITFASILEMFARMRRGDGSVRGCRALNLIISGRYDLRESGRLPEFMSARLSESRSAQLHAFTEPEARHYLSELRQVRDPKIVTAIYDRTGGDPFGTALFADLWHTDQSELTADKIRDYPNFEYAYLIDRIIARIPKHHATVQWLLRYAVIPRRLTKAFFSEVLLQFMPPEGGEATARDDPNRFPAAARQFEAKKPWNPLTAFDVNSLWQDLSLYSSQYSWVLIRDDVVRLQPEVIHPMRLLLRNNPVDPILYDDLHVAAEKYFARLAEIAETEDKPWAEWASEAIYHRFQRVGATAHKFWRRNLDRVQAADARERIAATVLDRDFLIDREPRAHPKTKTIVGYRTLVEASFELANIALLRRLRMKPGHPDAERLEREMGQRWSDSLLYEDRSAKRIITLSQRSLIRLAQRTLGARPASEQSNGSNIRTPTGRAVRVLRTVKDPLFRLTTKMLLAHAYALQKPDLADRYFREAYDLAARTSSVNLPTYYINLARGRSLLAAGNIAGSLEVLERAYREALEQQRKPSEAAEALRLLVEAAVIAGRFAQGSSYTKESRPDDDDVSFQAAISASMVDLLRGRALTARDRLSTLNPRDDGSVTGIYRRALRAEIAADVDATLMEFVAAERGYHEARSLYVSAGRINAPRNCVLKLARLDQGLGNSVGAVRRLAELEMLAAFTDQELAIEQRLLTLQCLALVSPSDGKGVWAQLRDVAAEDRSPRVSAQVLVTGLALGFADLEKDSLLLLKRLRAIEPAGARYPVLSAFRLFEGSSGSGALGAEDLLTAARRPDAAGEDFALHALPLADALRYFGGRNEAIDLLREALGKTEEPLLRRDIRQALVRSGSFVPGPEEVAVFQSWFANYPALCGAQLLEEAEILDRCADYDGAGMLLEQAREKVQSLRFSSQLNVRVGELRGRLARASGDMPQAVARFRQAISIARDMGAGARIIVRLTQTVSSFAANAAATRVSASDDFAIAADLVEISERDDEIEIRTVPLRGSGSQVKLQSPKFLLEPGGSPHGIARTIQGLALLPHGTDLPVALRIAPGLVSGLPWELAFLQGRQRRFAFRTRATGPGTAETVRWVQLCLAKAGREVVIDGIFGPQTAQALEVFARGMGAEGAIATLRPRLREINMQSDDYSTPIVIVQRDFEEERVAVRGHGAFGIELEYRYRHYGFRSVRAPTSDPVKFGEILDDIRPAVIHIVSGFLFDGGDVFLDLSRSGFKKGALLSAARINSLLRRWPANRLHPLIVLEAFSPPNPLEIFRQLLLRNMFAAQLLADGRVRGVLAFGFGKKRALETLAMGLAKRCSLRELYGEVLRDETWFGQCPASLFTTDPDLPAWI